RTTIFGAFSDGTMIGTISWTADGPLGFPMERDFGEECAALRAEGRRIAATWRIAVARAHRSDGRVVLALVKQVVQAMFEHRVLTFLATFNPRHQGVYERLLGFRTVASRPATAGLSNAPSLLMRCDLERMPARFLNTKEAIAAVVDYMRRA